MKRSEMVNLIANKLDEMIDNSVETVYWPEEILKLVENVDMLPPEHWRPHDWHERGLTYSQWIQEPSRIRKWEKE